MKYFAPRRGLLAAGMLRAAVGRKPVIPYVFAQLSSGKPVARPSGCAAFRRFNPTAALSLP